MAIQLNQDEMRQAQALGDQMFRASQAKKKKPKDRGNFFTNSLSTVGGIGGGILGSFIAPGLGTAAGGAAGAGAGKFLENLFEGNNAGEGVLGEAALGTLGGIGKGIKAIKGASGALKSGEGLAKAGNVLRFGQAAEAPRGFLGRMGAKMERGGGKMLNSQSELTAAQARQAGINPVEVFSNINKRTGLKNLDDMAEVGKHLTGGKDSILDTLTNSAIASSKGVNVPDLRKLANNFLDDSGELISDAKRKEFLNKVTRAATSMRGGAAGSLSPLADPTKAIKKSNAWKDSADRLTNNFNSTPEQKQLSKIYSGLAKHVDDAVYKSPGVDESVPMLKKAVADDLLFKAQDLRAVGNKAQAKAHEKIAKEILGAGSVAEIRSLKKDFVHMGKIDKATAQAQGARSVSGSNVSNKAGSIIRNPMNLVGIPLDAATPTIANIAAKAGRALQGGVGVPSVKSQAIKSGALQIPAQALTGQYEGGVDPAQQEAYNALPGENDIRDYFMQTGQVPTEQTPGDISTLTGSPTGGDVLGEQGGGSTYSREAAAQDIQNDLQATGGKNMDKYMQLYEFLNPEGDAKGKANATTQKALGQSANADATLKQLEGMLSGAGGAGGPVGGNISSFFGNLGLNNSAKSYNDLAGGSITQIAKALGETGTMSDSDRIVYGQLIPKITDTPEVAKAKFAALRERMATSKSSALEYGAGNGIEDALAAAGY